MSSSDSYSIGILNNITGYLHQYVIPVFYVVGNIGNFLTAVIFFKKSWRKNVCVFYFFVSLLVNTGYINSTMLGSMFTLGFNIHAESSSVILCKLFYYSGFLFSTLLPNVLTFASIDRLLLSSQNVDTRLYSSKRLAYLLISISTLVWIIFYIHALIKVNIYQFGPTFYACIYDLSGFYFEFVSYSSLLIGVVSSILLIILSILAFKNVRQIRAVPRQQRQQLRTMSKKDFQLLRCLYTHDIVYIICNTPLGMYYVYDASTRKQTFTLLQQAIQNFASGFCTFIHHIPYCTSFFIFICISKAFRHEMKRLIYKTCGKNLMPMQEEENKNNNERNNAQLDVVVSTIELPV